MDEYPSRLLVGLYPYQKVYLLKREELLIQFHQNVTDTTIQSILHQGNLQNYVPRPESKGIIALRAANMRWIVTKGKYHSLARFSDTLRYKWKEIKKVMPVYNEQGQGSESAASPLPDVIVAKFRAGSEEKMINYFKQETGLVYNQIMSDLLRPYYYFHVKPEEHEGEIEGQLSNAFDIIEKLSGMSDIDIVEYDWRKLEAYSFIPNDTLWPNQWNMARLDMPDAWNIQQGAANVSIAILDSGFDLAHPDLVFTPNIAPQLTHFNAEDASAGNQPPYNAGPSVFPHGTAVAGLVAATVNNTEGVAGLAGGCSIMPVRLGSAPPTADFVAAGINWAVNNSARVVSMSFGDIPPTTVLIAAINNAWNSGLVLCAASGNFGQNASSPPVGFPASHTNVIAVGASDQADQRKRPASADGECWGSQYGPELGVMAPGVLCWTTDEQGQNGWNTNNGGAFMTYCVNYASCGDASGNYFSIFNGTSAATPHVSGLAALLFSQYPILTNQQVRDIIERTCDKINPVMYPYVDDLSHPNGIWHQETGYGRINAFHALDFADVFIKDWPGDTGTEPSSPSGGDFWDFSDIVIRPTPDDMFVPNDPVQASNVKHGQTNYLYVQVTNNGPREARNVVVDVRIVPYVGTEFFYPTDWTTTDTLHIEPTLVAPLSTIPSGDSGKAIFTISSAQVEELWGWETSHPWHPCLLASVTADNDYAFMSSAIVGSGVITRRNNIAQRNLSVVEYLAGSSYSFPFIVGNKHNNETLVELVIDRSKIPIDMPLFLSIDNNYSAFPLFNLNKPMLYHQDIEKRIVFLERTRLEMILGCYRGVVTLEKGSSFDFQTSTNIEENIIKGGEIILKDNRPFLKIIDPLSVILIKKQPKQIYPFTLLANIPENAEKGQKYRVTIAQRNQKGVTVGGATLIGIIK
jgi:subtilisin family serine protease